MIRVRPLTAEAFAPFGTVVGAAAQVVPGPLSNARAHATPRLAWNLADAATLPLRPTVMERHRFSSQCFIPCDPAARWLVLVMPHAADGGPDPAGALAFVATGAQALTYAPDVWHHPLTALDAAYRFVLLTFQDDSPDDTEYRDLPPDLTIVLG